MALFHSFLWLSTIPLYIPHLLDPFIHLPSDFHILAIVNSAAMDMGCMCLSELEFSPEVCPRVGLQDHMLALFLGFFFFNFFLFLVF